MDKATERRLRWLEENARAQAQTWGYFFRVECGMSGLAVHRLMQLAEAVVILCAVGFGFGCAAGAKEESPPLPVMPGRERNPALEEFEFVPPPGWDGGYREMWMWPKNSV